MTEMPLKIVLKAMRKLVPHTLEYVPEKLTDFFGTYSNSLILSDFSSIRGFYLIGKRSSSLRKNRKI